MRVPGSCFRKRRSGREFLAKLLVILLGLQCSVVRAQEKPGSNAAPSPVPAQSAKRPTSLPARAPALKNARSAWAVGWHPSDSSWLSASVPNGVTPATLNVTASPGTMVPGTYTGHLTLTSGSNTSTVAVIFNIAATQSPCDVNTDGLINVRDIQKLVNETLGTQSAINHLTSEDAVTVVDIHIDANVVLQFGCKAH